MSEIVKYYNWFISPEVQRAFLPMKIVFFIVSIILFVAIIWFLARTSYLNNLLLQDWRIYRDWKKNYSLKGKKKKYRQQQNGLNFKSMEEIAPQKTITKSVPRTDWERILDKVNSGKPLQFNLALLDADKLLQKKLDGKELDEFYAQQINEVKELVEEVMADDARELTLEEVGKAIEVYKKAIDSLD